MISLFESLKHELFIKPFNLNFPLKTVFYGSVGGDQAFNYRLTLGTRKFRVEVNNLNFVNSRHEKQFIDSLGKSELQNIRFDLINKIGKVVVFNSQGAKLHNLEFVKTKTDFMLSTKKITKKSKLHCETGPALITYNECNGTTVEHSYWFLEGEDLTTNYHVQSLTDLQNYLILK